VNTRRYSEVAIGEQFGDSATVTEWHVATACALYNDWGPNHINAKHSAKNRFGGRIAHGFLTTGIMMGVAGRYFGWSIEAFLETDVRFLAPVYLDEPVAILWEVVGAEPKASLGGGIVALRGWCWAGDPERLAIEMNAKLALNDAEPPPGHKPPSRT
jgi:3-hydroxybutyryl-CoA dehydratase